MYGFSGHKVLFSGELCRIRAEGGKMCVRIKPQTLNSPRIQRYAGFKQGISKESSFVLLKHAFEKQE